MSEPRENAPQKYRMAIRRPVTMIMLFLTLVVFGWRSYQQLPVNLMPDISYPTLTVRTEYEGAAPEDVEKLVTRPLEEMLSIVSGMVEISSVSSPGLSEIILEFTWATDMNVAQQDVRDRLDLFEPPKEVTEKPVILRYDPTLDPVMRVGITARQDTSITDPAEREARTQKALTAIRDATQRHLKSDLEAESGIAQVSLKGGQEEEIQILVDAARLKSLGLSLDFVVNSLAQQNINLSGGRLQEGKTEYLVRTLNEFTSIDDIAGSILATPNGQPMRLAEVAEVFMGTKERETIVRIDGQEAVELDVYKEGDANTVKVCDTVKDLLGLHRDKGVAERIQEAMSLAMKRVSMGQPGSQGGAKAGEDLFRKRTLLDRLPANIDLHLISDQSRFIVGAINEVQDATVLGGLLALAVLFLFLREMRSTLIIGVAIPISVVTAFVPMFMREISLNVMSLGGLALGVGMLVDNSIVVLESVFRCREEGDGLMDAAERGTQEVAGAVVASTLTTVAVFFPVAFVQGIAGQLFGDLAMTVTFSLLASLLVALYLNPLMVSRGGLAPQADRQVVWILGAYREARSQRGLGRAAALLYIIPLGITYAGRYLSESAAETFGPGVRAANALRVQFSAAKLLHFLGAMVLAPFLVFVYLCQVVLRAVSVILVTILFAASLVLVAAATVIRYALWGVLSGPLWAFNVVFEAFRRGYETALRNSLAFSPFFIVLMLTVAGHAAYLGSSLGSELIPPMKQGEFGIRLEARAGTRLLQTEERAKRVEEIVRRHPEVASVTVQVGQERSSTATGRGENTAAFTILLKDPARTTVFQDDIVEELRENIGVQPDEEITFTLPSLFSFKTAVEVQIVGDDLNELRRIGRSALEQINQVPGLTDAELSVKPGYPEIIIELDRELLASKGLTPGQVAMRLRTEVQGEVATRFNRGGEKVDIRVRTDQAMLSSVEDLRQMSIVDGVVPIPLKDVARIRQQEGPSEIRRIDQRQVVLITANVEGRDLGSVSSDIQDAVRDIERPRDYYFVLGGQNRELQTSYDSLRFALALAVFLVYVVMACQFESIWHPALVMFSVPMAFIGVAYALYYTHTDLSIMVFLGGIILAGIVVNNAIVLVDRINQLRSRGLSKREAVVEAGTVRLRPIMMTTITTVLGLLPMVAAMGEGAELRRPLAITVMAGLSSSTLLTLWIIPMAYYLLGGRDKS
jgi:HAE1 family hydrophobic/amphiphilic exporter-1